LKFCKNLFHASLSLYAQPPSVQNPLFAPSAKSFVDPNGEGDPSVAGTSSFRVRLFARLQGSSTAHGEQIWSNTALLQQRADRFGSRQTKRYIVEPLASDVGMPGQSDAGSYL
jgi:hypothetical protein